MFAKRQTIIHRDFSPRFFCFGCRFQELADLFATGKPNILHPALRLGGGLSVLFAHRYELGKLVHKSLSSQVVSHIH